MWHPETTSVLFRAAVPPQMEEYMKRRIRPLSTELDWIYSESELSDDTSTLNSIETSHTSLPNSDIFCSTHSDLMPLCREISYDRAWDCAADRLTPLTSHELVTPLELSWSNEGDLRERDKSTEHTVQAKKKGAITRADAGSTAISGGCLGTKRITVSKPSDARTSESDTKAGHKPLPGGFQLNCSYCYQFYHPSLKSRLQNKKHKKGTIITTNDHMPPGDDFTTDPAHKYWTWSVEEGNWWHKDEGMDAVVWAPLDFD